MPSLLKGLSSKLPYSSLHLLWIISQLELLNIPFIKSDNVIGSWYTTIYYSVLGASCLIGGGLISVVLMLQNPVKNIILIVGLGEKEHPLIAEEETASAN